MHFIIHLFDGWNWVQAQYSGQLLISAKVWMKVTKNHTLTLNFVKKNHIHVKNLLTYKAEQFMLTNPSILKWESGYIWASSLSKVGSGLRKYILEDHASIVQVGDIEQVFSKVMSFTFFLMMFSCLY